ncbi:Protein of unknown function [Desulfatibacillum alkenivorans DSM 16219]|jgi:hypothetical protein|uniref:DUF1638 domain-containing protein n=1 Tax=Desulfatibacillum alkenivorans DSM 16219 TaxID=1121393 RepID=A0A1M6QRP5_9BACT|nr:Protein of unknown function [Desulfatibacillum alkenivorans DSM 16219]
MKKEKNVKLISCRALAHIIEPMVDPGMERVILDIGLHLNPDKLRERVIEEIARMEEDGDDIILGYGLCGRALEGVYASKARLILPRVDDCVGALLGSQKRHKKVMSENPGCFFLEPAWIGSEVDIFEQCQKGLERIPEERRPQIIELALKHYSKLGLLDHGWEDTDRAVIQCRELAEKHQLEFIRFPSDLTLVQDLTSGLWTPERFVIAHPGEKIPFF